ncbi:hypothetical protein ACQP3D_29045, partial [Escherichia coli]
MDLLLGQELGGGGIETAFSPLVTEAEGKDVCELREKPLLAFAFAFPNEDLSLEMAEEAGEEH